MRLSARMLVSFALLFGLLISISMARGDSDRILDIRKRGLLVCGVQSGFVGFAAVDPQGRYSGLEVDYCRALAAAILGHPSRVRFEEIAGIQTFLASDSVDLVSRRLTWSLAREERYAVRFGPVMFYDGQGFLARGNARMSSLKQVSKYKICVRDGDFVARVIGHLQGEGRGLQLAVFADMEGAERAFSNGLCQVLTADVSELVSVQQRLSGRVPTRLLPDRISREPLAALVRADDESLLQALRWTHAALIAAEEAGVPSGQVTLMKVQSAMLYAKLGMTPDAGRSIGLESDWLFNVLGTCGNYGEIYGRNLGERSSLRLDRGLNALWLHGGLMYAPSLR